MTSKHYYFFTLAFSLTLCFNSALSAQVGVGTNTPAYTFQVINSGNIGATALSESTNSGTDGVALSGYNSGATNGFNAFEGVTDGLSSGILGLSLPTTGTGTGASGISNSSDAVGVFGSIPTTGTWLGFGGLFAGGLGYADGLYNLSDERAKSDIFIIENALDKILKIKGYTYTYNSSQFNKFRSNNSKIHYGFMAQNVKEFLPYAVAEKSVKFSADFINPKSEINESTVTQTLNVVDYTAIIPVMVQAMKEQQLLIENQKTEIDTLKSKLSALEEKVNTLLKN